MHGNCLYWGGGIARFLPFVRAHHASIPILYYPHTGTTLDWDRLSLIRKANKVYMIASGHRKGDDGSRDIEHAVKSLSD